MNELELFAAAASNQKLYSRIRLDIRHSTRFVSYFTPVNVEIREKQSETPTGWLECEHYSRSIGLNICCFSSSADREQRVCFQYEASQW